MLKSQLLTGKPPDDPPIRNLPPLPEFKPIEQPPIQRSPEPVPFQQQSSNPQIKPNPGGNKHSEDAVVPALMKSKQLSFEDQLKLYDEQVSRGIDPSTSSNLIDQSDDKSRRFVEPRKSDGNAGNPLSLVLEQDLVA